MAPPLDPVRSDGMLPPRVDVVVVGGGIVGASTALFLSRRGISTVLCEKGVIGGEQSSRNWGWCRKMGRDPRELPLIIESMRLWQGLRSQEGVETGFRVCGIMYLCDRREELETHERWLEHARAYQLDSHILTGRQVADLLPGSTRSWAGALYTPSDGGAEPHKTAPALTEAARRHGTTIATSCAVRGVETQAGRVCGVVTERGSIACHSVVLAGGAWSRLFCGNLGLHLPQLKVLASAMRTEPLPGGPDLSFKGNGFGTRKRQDGGYIVSQAGATISDIVPDSFRLFLEFLPILKVQWKSLRLRVGRRFLEELRIERRWALDSRSPFEQVRVLDPEPAHPILDQAQRSLWEAFPFFREMRIAERWGGLIDVTPDELPVISPVESLPGFNIATGFSGHGFGLGPGAGRLMADLVTGQTPIVDPSPFRFSRFAKGNV